MGRAYAEADEKGKDLAGDSLAGEGQESVPDLANATQRQKGNQGDIRKRTANLSINNQQDATWELTVPTQT